MESNENYSNKVCENTCNHKVLMRDRTRRTARRVVSTRSTVLSRAGGGGGEGGAVPGRGLIPDGRYPSPHWDQRLGKVPGTEVSPRKGPGKEPGTWVQTHL